MHDAFRLPLWSLNIHVRMNCAEENHRSETHFPCIALVCNVDFYLVRLIKMCVSLRTSTKQIQIISERNKLSSYLTLSFSCQFVMLKKKWLQLQRRQRLRILVNSSILRPNLVVRGLLLLLAQHREGLVLKSTPRCDGGLPRSTRTS